MKCFKMWVCKIKKVSSYTKIDQKKICMDLWEFSNSFLQLFFLTKKKIIIY